MASAATAAAESAAAGEPSAPVAAEPAESAATAVFHQLLSVRKSVCVADGRLHMIAQIERGRAAVRTGREIHISKEVSAAVIQTGKARVLQFFIDQL